MPINKKIQDNNAVFISTQVTDLANRNLQAGTDITIKSMELFRLKGQKLANVGYEQAKGNLFEYIEASKFLRNNANAGNQGFDKYPVTDVPASQGGYGGHTAPDDFRFEQDGKVIFQAQAKVNNDPNNTANNFVNPKYNGMQKITTSDTVEAVKTALLDKQGTYDLPEVEEKETQAVQRNLTPWERVQLSRDKARPVGAEYIEELFTDFMEFHGDRYYQDDKAIIGGIARFHGMPVTVIAQAKGRTTKENIERNFGMPSPDGYRKALRLMKQAEKFNRPVICFVDTPGAFCGLEAEERGQGEAIARNLFEMSNLQVPILSVVIGEGGSGGALAMATSDEVWLLENSIYSILSPEGFASILWKDSSRAKEAAGVMKLTADRLLKAGIVERVIPEPENFNLETFTEVTDPMDDYISIFLKKYGAMTKEELTEKRYDRFRRM